jgi:hypothetical protein
MGLLYLYDKYIQHSETSSLSGGDHLWPQRRNTTKKMFVARDNNSIKISGYLLKFRVNSTSSYYTASTVKTQITHRNSTNPQK